MQEATIDNKNNYLEIIRQLPRPTTEQTEHFAAYVSNAHSWYKHLPIRPKVQFVLYLDPGAGMQRLRDSAGKVRLTAITDKSSEFHYTWQKTDDYRRRYGYWNYHSTRSAPSFVYASDGGLVSTAGQGLRIMTATGEVVAVPSDLVQKGTALVNAFMCPDHNFGIWCYEPENFGLVELPETERSLEAGMLALLATVRQDCNNSKLAQFDLNTLEDLKYGMQLWDDLEKALTEAMQEERTRQLLNMIQSMNQVVKAIYESD